LFDSEFCWWHISLRLMLNHVIFVWFFLVLLSFTLFLVSLLSFHCLHGKLSRVSLFELFHNKKGKNECGVQSQSRLKITGLNDFRGIEDVRSFSSTRPPRRFTKLDVTITDKDKKLLLEKTHSTIVLLLDKKELRQVYYWRRRSGTMNKA